MMVEYGEFFYEMTKYAILPAVASGFVNLGLISYITRKDDKFQKSIMKGFSGELPPEKEIILHCPSGQYRHIDSEKFNDYITKRK